MFSKAAYSIFLLRTSALISSLISVALVASSHLQYHFSSLYVYEGFEGIDTFRYVMAVGVISLLYSVVQLPFAALYALKHKSLMPLHLQFYADQVMSVLLATGSGAGIAVSCEFKNIFGVGGGGGGGGISGSGFRGRVHYDVYDYYIGNVTYTTENVTDKAAYSFFNKLLAGSVFLFLAWLCLALVSIISYNSNNNNSNNQTLSTNQHHRQANTVELSPKEPAKQTHVPTEDVRASTDDLSV